MVSWIDPSFYVRLSYHVILHSQWSRFIIRYPGGRGVESMGCVREDYIEFLKSRRSIRVFKPEPVPEDLLLKVLDTARYAPSAHNSQPWRFIIVDDPDVKEKLAKLHGGCKPLKNAP